MRIHLQSKRAKINAREASEPRALELPIEYSCPLPSIMSRLYTGGDNNTKHSARLVCESLSTDLREYTVYEYPFKISVGFAVSYRPSGRDRAL